MNFRDYLEEQLKNPEFRKEYEALELEYKNKQQLIQHQTGFSLSSTDFTKIPPPA